MTDSYHYESVPKFRVGGVYRDATNSIVRLDEACIFDGEDGWARASMLMEPEGEWRKYSARFRLSDGRWHGEFSLMHLAPGELIERDGQWVPADSIGPFPSGATLKVAGDKIVSRVGVTVTVAGGSGYSKPVEPIRPALDWNTATPFDTFGPDFIVTKGAEPTSPLYDSPTTDSAYPAIAGLLRG